MFASNQRERAKYWCIPFLAVVPGHGEPFSYFDLSPDYNFLDSDVEVTPGWLAGMLPHLDDDRVALTAPRVRAFQATVPLAASTAWRH